MARKINGSLLIKKMIFQGHQSSGQRQWGFWISNGDVQLDVLSYIRLRSPINCLVFSIYYDMTAISSSDPLTLPPLISVRWSFIPVGTRVGLWSRPSIPSVSLFWPQVSIRVLSLSFNRLSFLRMTQSLQVHLFLMVAWICLLLYLALRKPTGENDIIMVFCLQRSIPSSSLIRAGNTVERAHSSGG